MLLFLYFIRLPVFQLTLNGQIYYLRGETFQLEWIHSVENEKWIEIYKRDKNQLLLTKTILNTFGAGTPSDGKIIENTKEGVHMAVDRYLDEINLTVSDNVKTTIITSKENVVPLYKLTDNYSNINITVTYVYLWEYLGGRQIDNR